MQNGLLSLNPSLIQKGSAEGTQNNIIFVSENNLLELQPSGGLARTGFPAW